MAPWRRICVFLISIINALLVEHALADVTFTASPQGVQVPVTKTLHIRCSVLDSPMTAAVPSSTSTPSGGLVGRALPDTPVNSGIKKRSAPSPSSPDKVIHVTAMNIKRDGVPVAAVSTFTPALAESDVDKPNIHVTGDVTGDVSQKSGEMGYLDLVWDFPVTSQVGEYTCTVTAITASGHGVLYTRNLTVGKVSIDLDDVITEIRDLKRTVDEQNKTINTQQQTIEVLVNETAKQKSAFISEIDAIKKNMSKWSHVEVGSVDCGGSFSWPTGGADTAAFGHSYYSRQIHKSIVFQISYSKEPVVFLSVNHLDPHKDFHSMYGTQVLSVDKYGFSMRCGTYSDSDWRIHQMTVDWIAIPN